jgi:hypothetical protein
MSKGICETSPEISFCATSQKARSCDCKFHYSNTESRLQASESAESLDEEGSRRFQRQASKIKLFVQLPELSNVELNQIESNDLEANEPEDCDLFEYEKADIRELRIGGRID